MKLRTRLILFSILFFSFHARAQQEEKVLHQLNQLLVHTVMEDLYTPPVASRIYSYPHIAFYECVRMLSPREPGLARKLNGLEPFEPAPAGSNAFIAASLAFSEVAENLVASSHFFENWKQKFLDSLKQTPLSSSIDSSIKHASLVSSRVISWLNQDNYLRSRGMMRFTPENTLGAWQPTPADYMPGMEPHWKTIRPFTLKDPFQFSPKKKLVFDTVKNSLFQQNVRMLYDMCSQLDSNRKAMAIYWDDNPNVSVVEGHLTYFVHKISPGGHWLMIAQQAMEEKQIPLVKASQTYALTAIALMDAFISCWAEKYKTNLIRPITVINLYIDETWQPFIQTPPFPEFTSGHAVISNAAATVLTHQLGDNYRFTDKTEIPFGLQPRSFNSFYQAAYESSWSRVYGGIHYPLTAEISIRQGKDIGRHVIRKVFSSSKK